MLEGEVTAVGDVVRRFARGVPAVARKPTLPPLSAEEVGRFAALRGAWPARRRLPVDEAARLEWSLAVQVADAVTYAQDGRSGWLDYARVDRIAVWQYADRGYERDAVLATVREQTDIDVDAALRLCEAAEDIKTPDRWRSLSPLTAAAMEDSMWSAWNNYRRGGLNDPVLLTAWGWLVASAVDVGWDPEPAWWSSSPYPCTSAMAHVMARVLDRRVTMASVRYLFRSREVGDAAFAIQGIANDYACGVHGPEECEGEGRSCECPLIDSCESYRLGRFPHRKSR